jgi:hypothetical protein
MKYATIAVHTHQLPLDRSYRTYSWDGDIRGLVAIDYKRDTDINELPWRLIKIQERPEWGDALFARADSWLFLNAYAIKAVELAARIYRGFGARIIMTLHIWGIGNTGVGEEFRFSNLFRRSPWSQW